MPGSSELSDALNPNYYQTRQSTSNHVPDHLSPNASRYLPVPSSGSDNYRQQWQQQQRQQQQLTTPPFHATTSSTLADAVNPAAISPVVPRQHVVPKPIHKPPAEAMRLLKELIQSIHTYRATLASEKQRRATWEQQQEVGHLARQSELQARIAKMEQEVALLRASLRFQSTQMQPGWAPQPMPMPYLATSAAQHGGTPASSGSPVEASPSLSTASTQATTEPTTPEFVQGSSKSSPLLGKRVRSSSPGTEPPSSGKMKLRTHKELRPQSLQSAMRNHIIRCMQLDNGKKLPAGHIEGAPFKPTEPVRFVWENTTKKSAHNARMKERVVSDMLANKASYPLVPEQEFEKPLLEVAFEQSFRTLRRNYEMQVGKKAVLAQDNKAKRARRASRKKIKLNNRISARRQLKKYLVTELDAAFQIECMSSEESSEGEVDEDEDVSHAEQSTEKRLRIRYLAWKSSRLLRLFQIADEEYDRTKLKRGLARKERHLGQPKDGDPLPPQNASPWMISKKWLRYLQARDARAAERVKTAMQESQTTGEANQELLEEFGPTSEVEERSREQQQEEAIVGHTEFAHQTAVGVPQQTQLVGHSPEYFQQPIYAHGGQAYPGAPDLVSYNPNPQLMPPQAALGYERQSYLPGETFVASGYVDASYDAQAYAEHQHVPQYPYNNNVLQ